jgi:hypothetical protein
MQLRRIQPPMVATIAAYVTTRDDIATRGSNYHQLTVVHL